MPFAILAEGACPANRRAAPVVVVVAPLPVPVAAAVVEVQNCELGGIVIGGGTLYRFPEEGLLEAEETPVAF